MELTKDWGDMVVLGSTSQETSSSVLNGLKVVPGSPASKLLQQSSLEVMKACMRHSAALSVRAGLMLAMFLRCM